MVIPPKIINTKITDGKLIYMDLIIRDEVDWGIFQSFLSDEIESKKCKLCGKEISKLTRENCRLRIQSPLSDSMGFKLANPVIKCPSCNEEYEMFSSLDYTPLVSVTNLIKQLKDGVKKKYHG